MHPLSGTVEDRGTSVPGITWPPLLEGILVSRYKRFMADVKLGDGHVVTAHCPNSGSMKGCSVPGQTVYLSRSANPKRRLPFTWELIEMPTSLVCVNTGLTNRLVKQSIAAGLIPALSGYRTLRAEVNCGNGSRIDLVLEDTDKAPCFVEIKSSTLVEGDTACFPDAVTARGLKHLVELQRQVGNGNRAVNFFLVQRTDAERFQPADHIDPEYGRELRAAHRKGVEVLCYDVCLTLQNMALHRRIPCEL